MIKEYIQFAIDNGYELNKFNKAGFDIEGDIITIYSQIEPYKSGFTSFYLKYITSKKFITAVARGLEGKYIKHGEEPTNEDWGNLYYRIQRITTEQAFAIRDNTLDTFIKGLLDNK